MSSIASPPHPQPQPVKPRPPLRRWTPWRSLMMAPFLFLILMGAILTYTLFTLGNFREQSATMEALSNQRLLRSQYFIRVVLQSQGVPQPEYRTSMRDLLARTHLLQNGGWVHSPLNGSQTRVPPPINPKVARLLAKKERILREMAVTGDTLVRLGHKHPRYAKVLQQFYQLNAELENPRENLMSEYLLASNQRMNWLMEQALLLVLLLGGTGFVLSVQQRHFTQSLTTSTERFQQVFEMSPIGKILLNWDGDLMDANPAFCQLLGYSENELLGKSIANLVFAEDWAESEGLVARLREGEIQSYQLNQRYRHKMGQAIWVLATVGSVRDAQGLPLYMVLQVLDTSEQRRFLEVLQSSEARYRNVFESATDGIIIGSMDSHVLSANSKAHQIFGYAPGEMIGLPLIEMMPLQYRQAHLAGMHRLEETGVPRLVGKTLEFTGLRKNGTEFPLELSISTWHDPQNTLYCTAILRDVSERKQSEEERLALVKSNQALGEFAVIASHDLQEPLRKIAFYTERFAQQEGEHLSEESLCNRERILAAVQRMHRLLRDLVSYSQVSARLPQLQLVDLNMIVSESLSLLKKQLDEAKTEVVVETLPIILADDNLIQVLFNQLIENAVKFRRDGVCPTLRIYANVSNSQGKLLPASPVPPSLNAMETPQDEPHSQASPSWEAQPPESQAAESQAEEAWLEIHIEDNGIGFDEKYLDRIFKIFQRLHPAAAYGGTGIGLAICQRIAEVHHGALGANSQPGVGTVFHLKLPVARAG